LNEARGLIESLLDGRLSPESARRLEKLVCENRQVRSLYVRYLHQESVIAAHYSGVRLNREEGLEQAGVNLTLDSSDAMILPAIRLHEEPADTPAIAPPLSTPARQTEAVRRPSRQRRAAYLGIAAAVLLGAILGLAWMMSRPRTNSYAKIVRSVDASFADNSLATADDTPLPKSSVALTRGVIQIKFATGAQATIEAPAEFAAGAAGRLSLISGKLWALVPPPAVGFTVLTPSARIVDLGTEFGVQLNPDETTNVEVFKGKVQAAPLDGSTGEALKAGQTAAVTSTSLTVLSAVASPQHFVQSLEGNLASLDVADLISGGDGTGRHDHVAINPGTGEVSSVPVENYQRIAPGFHPVPGIPVLAGIFVPNGKTQIYPDGQTFAFPKTVGSYCISLWTGGQARFIPPTVRCTLRVGGAEYIIAPHRILWLHSNKGVTLDLQAVRRLHPGMSLTRFRCFAGNCASPGTLGAHTPELFKSDLFVIVDGKTALHRSGLIPGEQAHSIDIPLRPGARYLTLATTDGGDGISFDWIVLADARLN
jgi:hypothetical protein